MQLLMGFYILTWNFGKRNPVVKGSLESLDLNVNRSDLSGNSQATAKTPNSVHILKKTKCTDKLS